VRVTVSRAAEFPDRKLPYVVRWRLNGRGHWRSFATKRGSNGADAFFALLKIAAMNERDWDSDSVIPSSMSAPSGTNAAAYCRSFITGEWQRLSPSTRKSYVEALTSFIVNCRRRGAPRAPSQARPTLSSWLTPSPKCQLDDGTVEWVWNDEPLPRNIQAWIDKNSPLLVDLNRELLYETDKRVDGLCPRLRDRALALRVRRYCRTPGPW
jgi:hypothetical protein